MITCDEIISVMNVLSMKMANTIATNVSINFDDKKRRYQIITINNYYYLLSLCEA